MFFLSASIPDPRRDPAYFETADPLAIRDAVRALATVVIPRSHLVWGGHPAISALIKRILSEMQVPALDHVTIYQSRFFEKEFPEANKYFNQRETEDAPNPERIIYIDQGVDKADSLRIMRARMLHDDKHPFSAGIFIGGMEGVEKEYILFREYNPKALLLPIASTGGAAAKIYAQLEKPDPRLESKFTYMDLFRSLLQSING